MNIFKFQFKMSSRINNIKLPTPKLRQSSIAYEKPTITTIELHIFC